MKRIPLIAIGATSLMLIACKDEASNENLRAPEEEITVVKYDCSIGEYNYIWVANSLQAGANLDSLIGCATKITFSQNETNPEGLVIAFRDHTSKLPVIVVQTDPAKKQISGRLYRLEPAIYSGLKEYNLENGTTFSAATFTLISAIKNPKFLKADTYGLEKYIGKRLPTQEEDLTLNLKFRGILQGKADDFFERYTVTTAIVQTGEFIFGQGAMPHGFGTNEVAFCISTNSGKLQLGIRKDGYVSFYGATTNGIHEPLKAWAYQQ